MTRILLVEDDAQLAQGLRWNLEREGYEVTWAPEGGKALHAVATHRPDLVVLDLGLPDCDGTDVLRRLRESGDQTPVLCLTARDTEDDQVRALGLGADDYITKPFGLRILLARIAAAARRTPGCPDERLVLGARVVDLASHTVSWGSATAELTPIEVDILRHFIAHRGEARDRQDVLRCLWGLSKGATTRTLDNHIARLRRKIEDDPKSPRWLVTVHGVGYRLV